MSFFRLVILHGYEILTQLQKLNYMHCAFNSFPPPNGANSLKIREKIKFLVATLTSKTGQLR